ncbi:putative hydrolase [Alloactinosynnema sp. L-07]|uniref:alpha/beta fold hydrolase n=1 Tax=Alloactinosynnema sp. L-07 TaxID=1653480 RepID=UPI00065EF1BF|nr:alpha/beta hydrolase [Alloactinosynnema sp. L-07]CRK61539.1 putative hydrolase [Alloactinosynnema sp. L-07]
MDLGSVDRVLLPNGVRLNCARSGSGAPAVLLHGLGHDTTTWDPVPLPVHRHAFDLRGHGRSDRTPTYSLELMADDVIHALTLLGLDRPLVIGHSMGAVVASLVAAERPDLVGDLVLEEPRPPVPADPPAASMPNPEDETLPYDWRVVRDIRVQIDNPAPNRREALSAITARTLVIAGGPTSQIPQDALAEYAGMIKDSTLVTIDAGHTPHRDASDEFLAVVTEWLSS